jgi:hypothetical protein
MERNLIKSIVAARPPYIARCVREALRLYQPLGLLLLDLLGA